MRSTIIRSHWVALPCMVRCQQFNSVGRSVYHSYKCQQVGCKSSLNILDAILLNLYIANNLSYSVACLFIFLSVFRRDFFNFILMKFNWSIFPLYLLCPKKSLHNIGSLCFLLKVLELTSGPMTHLYLCLHMLLRVNVYIFFI